MKPATLPAADLKSPLNKANPSVKCADCGRSMILRTTRYGLMWGCAAFPMCRGTHGAHPDGTPLGTPATSMTKAARIEAHAAFDLLWRGGTFFKKRHHAYSWLRHKLHMTSDECHIGNFTSEQCAAVVAVVQEFMQDPGGNIAAHEAYIEARKAGAA